MMTIQQMLNHGIRLPEIVLDQARLAILDRLAAEEARKMAKPMLQQLIDERAECLTRGTSAKDRLAAAENDVKIVQRQIADLNHDLALAQLANDRAGMAAAEIAIGLMRRQLSNVQGDVTTARNVKIDIDQRLAQLDRAKYHLGSLVA